MTTAATDRALSGRLRRRLRGAALVAAVVAATVATGGSPAAAGPAATAAAAAQAPRVASLPGLRAGSYQVTLITGDRVTLRAQGGGRYAVDVAIARRADGSTPVVDVNSTRAKGSDQDSVYALPDDVLPLIASGQLDRELFNVAYLVRNGYDDATSGTMPVIVQDAKGTGARAAVPNALPATSVTATLESIDAAGMRVGKAGAGDFWAALSGGGRTSRAAALPAGIKRIWLDRRYTVGLDESVPQIGAPEAWAAGFDGTGVDAAVLDTGIDLNHPDLAGKIAATRSFVPGESVTDGHGHGTHVASIVAGTGAASNGRFTGVARGARLIVGKVLGDNGVGDESDVIDGMEWATVEEGAKVVNLSLGSDPTDGTDPASQAVDELTRTTGALFVIAAGNTGPASFSVSSPGAADAALTVGAVDKQDVLAGFSSRGPRVGDHAIKPEITAPGVGITAARAAGTFQGVPFDDFYTTLSGTSMATPHVAGAAAILAQEHPDWRAEQIKAALVSSARDDGDTVYEQGSGRVDVARAFRQNVQVAPVTADFALLPSPVTGPARTKVLTYTNSTDSAVSLDLTATLHDVDGKPVADGVLSAGPATVEVPPHGTATTTVTLDATGLASALYSGSVVASGSGDLRLTTPVGFAVGEQEHQLQISVTPRENVANFQFVGVLIFGVEGPWAGQVISCGTSSCPQPLQFPVAKGTYAVRALVSWNDAAGERQLATLLNPEFTVSADAQVVLDANAAQRISVATEQPSSQVASGGMTIFRSTTDDAFRHIDGIFAGANQSWWVTPTARVAKGDLAVAVPFLLEPPTPAGQMPAYLYQVKVVEEGRVGDSQVHTYRDRDLVAVDNHYHADQPGAALRQIWFTWAPWDFFVAGVNLPVTGQTTLREFVAPVDRRFIHERSVSGPGSVDETIDVYRQPGRRDVEWNERPNAPGAVLLPADIGDQGLLAPLWWWVCAACRQGDNFYPFMQQTAPGERNTQGQFGTPFTPGEMHLFRDGVELAQAEPFIGAFTTYQLPSEQASYRLTFDNAGTSTSWNFTSSRPQTDATPPGQGCVETVFSQGTNPCRAQPLLFLRYDAGVGIDNRVPAPGSHQIVVDVYRQDGSAVNVQSVKFWFSTDDGAHWQLANLKSLGQGRYLAKVHYPLVGGTAGRVSMRAEAQDTGGSRIEQTIIGAFGLRDRTVPRAA